MSRWNQSNLEKKLDQILDPHSDIDRELAESMKPFFAAMTAVAVLGTIIVLIKEALS